MICRASDEAFLDRNPVVKKVGHLLKYIAEDLCRFENFYFLNVAFENSYFYISHFNAYTFFVAQKFRKDLSLLLMLYKCFLHGKKFVMINMVRSIRKLLQHFKLTKLYVATEKNNLYFTLCNF